MAEIFESVVQAGNLKGEDSFFPKIADRCQNYSVKCPSLFVSPGMFPFDFCGASQLPV